MSYLMMSEREQIDGFWYYYLRATGKWHVFIHVPPDMVKIVENVDTLERAKDIARKFAKLKKENNE